MAAVLQGQRDLGRGKARAFPGWAGVEICVPARDGRLCSGALSSDSVAQPSGRVPCGRSLWSWTREAGCSVPSREGLPSLGHRLSLCTPVSAAPFCTCPPGVTQPRWLPSVGCCLSVAAGSDEASRDC